MIRLATAFLIVIYASFVSIGLPNALLGVVWPSMQAEFHMPYSFAGFISMAMTGGTVVMSLLSSRIIRRFGTGRAVFASVLLMALSLLGYRFAPSYVWALALAVPLGLGIGTIDCSINGYVSTHYKSRHMNWLHCFWGLGSMAGPMILSLYLAHRGSWRSGYLIIAVMQFVLAGALFFTLPLWDKVAKLRTAAASETPGGVPKESAVPKSALFPLKIRSVRLALFTCLFYCGVESTLGLWGNSFLVKAGHIGAATAATWISVFYGSVTAGRLIAGFVTLKLGDRAIIRTGQALVLGGALLLCLPVPHLWFLFGFILMGLGCAPIFPCVLHETPGLFGKEGAQAIVSLQVGVAYVGSTLFPPAFGFVASGSAMQLFPPFILLLMAGMLFCSELLNARVKRGTL